MNNADARKLVAIRRALDTQQKRLDKLLTWAEVTPTQRGALTRAANHAGLGAACCYLVLGA